MQYSKMKTILFTNAKTQKHGIKLFVHTAFEDRYNLKSEKNNFQKHVQLEHINNLPDIWKETDIKRRKAPPLSLKTLQHFYEQDVQLFLILETVIICLIAIQKHKPFENYVSDDTLVYFLSIMHIGQLSNSISLFCPSRKESNSTYFITKFMKIQRSAQMSKNLQQRSPHQMAT